MNVSVNELEDILSQSTDTGNYEVAIDQLANMLEQDPENGLVSFYLGLLLVRVQNYQRGIRYLELARSSPLDLGQKFRCLIFLGKAYADVKAFSKAERAFREALQTGVPEPGAYSALGAVFYERNMTNQAIDALRKALDIDPSYASAINNLGYILIETKKDIEEGMTLCRKAVELDPKNPAYRDSLARALMESSSYDEAKLELENALEIDPDNLLITKRMKELLKKMEK